MIIDTTTALPPIILQRFNPLLLSSISPKLCDCSETFEVMWKEAQKLWKKLDSNPKRRHRCEQLKKEILELYERAKIKEKEREGQKNHKTQKFGYHVAMPKKLDQDVYARLRLGRKDGSFRHRFRKNNAIYKAKEK